MAPNIRYGIVIVEPAHSGPSIVAKPTTLLLRPILNPVKQIIQVPIIKYIYLDDFGCAFLQYTHIPSFKSFRLKMTQLCSRQKDCHW